MNDDTSRDNLVDLQQARALRRHDLDEARLQRVRRAFEQALPLPGKAAARGKNGKKGKSPRKKK